MQTHIIGKQIIELGLGPDQNAFAMQQEISRILQNQVMPRLEALLNRMISPDMVIRLEQLELDLGYINPDELERDFTEVLLSRFERVLTEKLEQALSASGFADVQGVPTQLTTLAAWKFFLEKGFLPWWTEVKDWAAWEEKIIAAMGKSSNTLFTELNRLRINQEDLLKRLTWQFSDAVLLGLVQSHKPELATSIPDMLKDFSQLSRVWTSLQLSSTEHRAFFWIAILGYLFDGKKEEPWEKEFLQVYLKDVGKKKGRSYKDLLQESCEASLLESSPQQSQVPEQLEKVLLTLWKEESENDISFSSLEERRAGKGEGQEPESLEPKANDERDTRKHEAQTLDEETALFVQNAGVVLLHPFLPALFEALGYTKSSDFITEELRHRAIHLIQYLANGKFEATEPELSLNKLLCGLPLSMPIEGKMELNEEEKSEAEHLLQTVVGHWKALRNTSPDGLRVNYFIREGKLAFTSMGWKLQVEQKTQDIMLNKLPWGVGAIKMPWMPDMLRVEWN